MLRVATIASEMYCFCCFLEAGEETNSGRVPTWHAWWEEEEEEEEEEEDA